MILKIVNNSVKAVINLLKKFAVLRSCVRLAHGDVVFVLTPADIHVPVLYYALMSVGAVMSPANMSMI